MTERTYPEMLRESIDIAKNMLNEGIPMACFHGYVFGSLTKKEIKEMEKKNPKAFDFTRGQLKKAQELIKGTICKKCNEKVNLGDMFCAKCGEKISNINEEGLIKKTNL